MSNPHGYWGRTRTDTNAKYDTWMGGSNPCIKKHANVETTRILHRYGCGGLKHMDVRVHNVGFQGELPFTFPVCQSAIQ